MNEPRPGEKRFTGSELNFLPDAQQVLSLAQKEANRLNHHFLGTEHLLLGMIALGHGVGFSVLVKLGLDLETVRKEIERQIGGASGQKPVGNPPYTPRAKKVIALAQKEARSLSHTYLGTEHLLLGLLREGDGVAGKVLKDLGVELEKTRQEILKELDPNLQPGSSVAQKTSGQEKSPAEPLRDWLSRYLKPDPVDLTKRYDVYCIQHGESTVYRNVLFKNVKGLLQDRETDVHALYIEFELADGKSVFLPKSAILKFADPGASAAGEKIPPSGKT